MSTIIFNIIPPAARNYSFNVIPPAVRNISFNVAKGNNLPGGGTTGQILSKQSDNPYDVVWVDLPPSHWETLQGLPEDNQDLVDFLNANYSTPVVGANRIAFGDSVTGAIKGVDGFEYNEVTKRATIDGLLAGNLATNVFGLQNTYGTLRLSGHLGNSRIDIVDGSTFSRSISYTSFAHLFSGNIMRLDYNTNSGPELQISSNLTGQQRRIFFYESSGAPAVISLFGTNSAGLFNGTSLPKAGSFYIASKDPTIAIPTNSLVLHGKEIVNLIGTSGSNIGMRHDNVGVRWGRMDTLHIANTLPFEVTNRLEYVDGAAPLLRIRHATNPSTVFLNLGFTSDGPYVQPSGSNDLRLLGANSVSTIRLKHSTGIVEYNGIHRFSSSATEPLNVNNFLLYQQFSNYNQMILKHPTLAGRSITIQCDSGSDYIMATSGSSFNVDATLGELQLRTYAAKDMNFLTNLVKRLTIGSSGIITLGTRLTYDTTTDRLKFTADSNSLAILSTGTNQCGIFFGNNASSSQYALNGTASTTRVNATTTVSLQIAAVDKLTITTSLATFSTGVLAQLLNLPVIVNAAPTDGDVWREDNTDTGLKVRINGITKTITVS